MLYWRENTEAVIFIFITKRNKRFFISWSAWRGSCSRCLWPCGEKLMHDIKVFIFSLGAGKERLGFGFLAQESLVGFGLFNDWLKKSFGKEPISDQNVSQFWLFVKFWPPFYFKGSLKDNLCILSVVIEVPHPNPRKKEVCTKTEERRKLFFWFRGSIMGFEQI